jgi:L-lactate dehydrogenase complex protein LldE
MNVEIFIPCFVDQLYPQTAINMIKLLERAGCKVHYNEQQTCCGQPAFNAGFWDQARSVGEKFLKDFAAAECVVMPSASCCGFVKNYYPKLFENSAQHNTSKNIGKKVFELSDFLVNKIKFTNFDAMLEGKATYHDSCAGLRECKIKSEPRELLKNVKGLELVEMNETDSCCGFGGTFAVKFDDISNGMATQKLDNVLATGAKYLISTDVSCLMHLQGKIDKEKMGVQSMHLADVLASGW